ncbi:MAG: shikimate kinase [bacterium]
MSGTDAVASGTDRPGTDRPGTDRPGTVRSEPRAVLVGLPGAGKSSAARRLASRLGVEAADSDDLVEARAGRSVAEIFADDGEPAFRALEEAAVALALGSFAGVLSLGGGAVLAPGTRKRLRDSASPVIHLVTTVEAAMRYTAGSDRPLLAADPSEVLARLQRERTPLYDEVATARVSTGGRPWPAIVADLLLAIGAENAVGSDAAPSSVGVDPVDAARR